MNTWYLMRVPAMVSLLFLLGCKSAATPPPALTSTPVGQMETQIASTIYANETMTAGAEQARAATLTAAIPSPTVTPEATTTPDRFNFQLPADGCWVNSEIRVLAGQTAVIRASGNVNTWEGRAGSSSNPDGQKGLCGAIQCPLQGVGYGALIGRVEDGPSFFVGTMTRYTAEKEGQLYFTVNDWECEDNTGVFDIQITFP